jgi:hypothetical protein
MLHLSYEAEKPLRLKVVIDETILISKKILKIVMIVNDKNKTTVTKPPLYYRKSNS